MSARAYLPADYRNAVVDAFEGLRKKILNRQAQNLIAADDASQRGNGQAFAAAMSAVAAYRAVLDDIALAIAKEQGR